MPPSHQDQAINKLVCASSMNQNGATLLFSGRVSDAAKSFENALNVIGLFIPSSLLPPIPDLSSLENKDVADGVEQCRGFVYAKPFYFNRVAPPTEADLSSYLAVIVFNLALTYQTVGEGLRDGSKYLLAAENLYGRSLGLLDLYQTRFDCSNIIIASLNNLACLDVDLCRTEKACRTLAWLEALIQQGRVRTDTVNGNDMADVILNMRLLLLPVCAGAA